MTILQHRSAGLLIPLFSVRTGQEWGVGELGDLPELARWARTGGLSCVMTLPLLEPSPGQNSPYSSGSFFALDPLYVRVEAIPESREVPLSDVEERMREEARAAPAVSHEVVRALKDIVLRRCFALFSARVDRASERARDLAQFEEEQRHWLPAYALFRALKMLYPSSWRDWPKGLRDAEPAALAEARAVHASEIAYRTWLQWIAFRQFEAARREARAVGVALGGDEPFLVADDSADVWARKELFRFDATVGAPPDAFSADGQEWGLPPYRWDTIASDRYSLFIERGRHTARLFDLVRIDHVVGLYRTYHRPLDKSPHFFYPADPTSQKAQGEAVLRAFASAGTEIIAEDLGVIPELVRRSLEHLKVPGYRVLRWEKDGEAFRDPASWPELSVATTGTHDTESAIEWWESMADRERAAIAKVLDPKGHLGVAAARHHTEVVHRAVLDVLYGSPSRLVLLPVQDLLGLRDRINTPNTVGPHNWSWRMPWRVSVMREDEIVAGRMRALRRLAIESGREPSA